MPANFLIKAERIAELTLIHTQMCKEPDNKKFWALARQFDNLQMIFKLEDEINDKADKRTVI